MWVTRINLVRKDDFSILMLCTPDVCTLCLQLWARNCQFGLNPQQKLSLCKFWSNLYLAAQKADFVDFPRFPGSVVRSRFLGGSQLVTGIQTGGNLHSQSHAFSSWVETAKNWLFCWDFRGNRKAFSPYIECRHGTWYIFGDLVWRNHNFEPLLKYSSALEDLKCAFVQEMSEDRKNNMVWILFLCLHLTAGHT